MVFGFLTLQRIEEMSSEINDIWMRCHGNLAAAQNTVYTNATDVQCVYNHSSRLESLLKH